MEQKIIFGTKCCVSANILKFVYGTNCPCGGDAGHGGKTILKIEDGCSTCWDVFVNGHKIENPETLTIILYGDCENETFREGMQKALDFYNKRYLKNTEKKDAVLQSN